MQTTCKRRLNPKPTVSTKRRPLWLDEFEPTRFNFSFSFADFLSSVCLGWHEINIQMGWIVARRHKSLISGGKSSVQESAPFEWLICEINQSASRGKRHFSISFWREDRASFSLDWKEFKLDFFSARNFSQFEKIFSPSVLFSWIVSYLTFTLCFYAANFEYAADKSSHTLISECDTWSST